MYLFGLAFEIPTQTLTLKVEILKSQTYKLNKFCIVILNICFNFFLQAGDKIGILKKSNGSLHFFINEEDQGEAVSNLPAYVYGAVDIYGAAVKVSIISGRPVQEQDFEPSNSLCKFF